LAFTLYTILPLPILFGIYNNNGGSGGNIILRNGVGDNWGGLRGGGGGACLGLGGSSRRVGARGVCLRASTHNDRGS